MFKKKVLIFIAKRFNDLSICQIVDYYMQWNELEGIESDIRYEDGSKATLKIYKKMEES